MPQLVLEISDDFIQRLADAVALRTLDNAGMTKATESPQTARSDDPWAGTSTTTAPPQTGSGGRPDTITIDTPSGKQTVTFNPAGGPVCGHGNPAALYEGRGRKGPWKQYRCALAAGDNWKNKCDFSEWA